MRQNTHPVLKSLALLALVGAFCILNGPLEAQETSSLFPTGWGNEDVGESISAPGCFLSFILETSPAQAPILPATNRSLDRLLFFSTSAPEKGSEPRSKVRHQSDGDWGSFSAQTVVQDGPATIWQDPQWKRAWKTDQTWRPPVAGPFQIFGEFGATSDDAVARDLKFAGRTGLACKIPVGPGGEVMVRGGPSVSYTDPLRTERTRERSELLLEVQARWPLLAGIGLEYQGSAAPALSPLDRDWINHDLRLAFPVGTAGKFKVGAKHHWENYTEPKPWSDGMQVYFGLELTR
jgi:hypothetical protein